MSFWENLLICIGRICLSSVFIWAGMAKVTQWKGTITYMQSKKMPMIPLLLPIAIILQVIGGAFLALGFYTSIAAFFLIVFLIPAAIKMHDFWNINGPTRVLEKTFFMKDVSILGGLLLILIFGPGHFSIDG